MAKDNRLNLPIEIIEHFNSLTDKSVFFNRQGKTDLYHCRRKGI
ncbi:hypothetical protein ACT5YR_02395 [Fructobacillus fructosus]